MKKKLLLLVLPLIMLCLLTGCGRRVGINYTYRNMPENSRIHILLKSDTDKPLKPKYRTDSEIEHYYEDGWYCGDIYVDGVDVDTGYDTIVFTENEKDLPANKIAKKYGSIKLAVTDKEGKIAQISPEFELKVQGQCWKKINYDYLENEITGVEATEYDEGIFDYDRWKSTEHDLMVIAMFFNWLFIMVVLSMNENRFSSSFPILNAVASVPNILYFLCINIVHLGRDISFFYAEFLAFFFAVFIFFSLWGWRTYYRLRREAEKL